MTQSGHSHDHFERTDLPYLGAQVDSAKLNEWLRLIGVFAVVASLIFVGLQIRQTDAIALSQIYQERAIAARESALDTANNPIFLTGMAKLYVGKHEELTAQEAIALEYDIGTQLVVYDNYLVQYELGYIADDYWARTVADMKCSLEHPYFREAIQGWVFREKFQNILDEVMADAIQNPTGCWNFEFEYPVAE